MNEKKTKVLLISDSARLMHVGQAHVCREIGNRLVEQGYDVEQLGFGDSAVKEPVQVKFKITSCFRQEMDDPNKVSEYIKGINPDVILFSHDVWLFNCVGVIRQLFPKIKIIGYLTVDGAPVYYKWKDLFKAYHRVVTPSVFSKNTIQDKWCDVDVRVVPYGVDHGLFHPPAQGKEQLKREIQMTYSQQGGVNWLDLTGKFVAIFVGANQDRKNLGLIHSAWRDFEKGKNDVRLLMFVHSASLTEEVGSYDLAVFLHDTYSIRVVNNTQPDQAIAQFMAASDVLLHPCAGEGFGLTVVEAMACGTVPVIIPYAALSDFCVNENSYQIPYITHIGGFHVNRALAPAANVVQCLEDAYQKKENRVIKAQNAFNTAQKYTWDACVEGIKKNIEEVMAMDPEGLYLTRVV